MKILVISQFFWPENFHINLICKNLSGNKHNITILTSFPNYPNYEIYEKYFKNKKNLNKFYNCRVLRLPTIFFGKSTMRYVLNYLSFLFTASTLGLWKIRKENYDIVLVYQTSPATVIIPALIYKKINKVPVIAWVLDLWPDTLISMRNVNNKIIVKILKILMNKIYTRCDLLLGQSKSMTRKIKQRFKGRVDCHYFPSIYINPKPSKSLLTLKKMKINKNNFNIFFTGNIGEAQDFETILNAAKLLDNEKNIKFYIVGTGNKIDWLKEKILEEKLNKNIKLLGHYPEKDMGFFYNAADALLVSLKSFEIFEKTVPGKIQSYLWAGKPIIASISGEASEIIKKSNSGLTNPSGNFKLLAKNILKLSLLTKKDLKKLGNNGIKYAKKNYNEKKVVKQLEKYMADIIN